MNLATRVQILNENCLHFALMPLGKGMYPSVSPKARGK